MTIGFGAPGFESSLRRKFFGDLGLLDLRPDHGDQRPWFYGTSSAWHTVRNAKSSITGSMLGGGRLSRDDCHVMVVSDRYRATFSTVWSSGSNVTIIVLFAPLQVEALNTEVC